MPAGDHEVLVDVLAVGLHPRTRSGAAGSHYTSTGRLPMVPGIDGVGRLADGSLRYFAADDDQVGTMADRAVIDRRRSIELPAGADVLAVAAAMNPAMSSWVALRRRVPLTAGHDVLVLGATGNGGHGDPDRRLLGPDGGGRVGTRIGSPPCPRWAPTPSSASPTTPVPPLAAAAADVDIVLDYLWAEPARQAMVALLTARTDRSRPLDWIQIGSVAGPTLVRPRPRCARRLCASRAAGRARCRPAYLAELPSLVDAIDAGTIRVTAVPRALADVEQVWTEPERAGERTVFVPVNLVP